MTRLPGIRFTSVKVLATPLLRLSPTCHPLPHRAFFWIPVSLPWDRCPSRSGADCRRFTHPRVTQWLPT